MTEEAELIKVSLESNQGMYLRQLTDEALEEAGCLYLVAVLPKDYDERIRYLGNILVQMIMSKRKGDAALKMELNTVASTLSYLLNSTSSFEDEYKPYDKQEVDRRLRRATRE